MKKAVSSVGSVYSIIEKFEQLTDQVLVPTMLSDVYRHPYFSQISSKVKPFLFGKLLF
jgi:hypothetical protein